MYVNDNVRGSFTLYTDSNLIVAQLLPANAKFGSSISKNFCYLNKTSPENFANDILVYPNPSNQDVLNLSSTSQEIKTIELYSVTGQLIANYSVNATSYKMSLLTISAGMYYLKVIGSSAEVIKPFVRY